MAVVRSARHFQLGYCHHLQRTQMVSANVIGGVVLQFRQRLAIQVNVFGRDIATGTTLGNQFPGLIIMVNVSSPQTITYGKSRDLIQL